MFHHLLVPTDGSQLSRDTARRAVAFAKSVQARITAFYARSMAPSENYGDLVDTATRQRLAIRSEETSKTYLGFIHKLCKEAGVDCQTISVRSDTPWEAIVAAAESYRCDLIFLSKHGRGGLSSLLLGSETYRVLTHSRIPVLVCCPPESEPRRRKLKAKRRDRADKKP